MKSERPSDDLGFELPEPARFSGRKVALATMLGAAALAGAFVVGYLPKRRAQAAIVEAAKASSGALMRVQVISPKTDSSDRALELPGSILPLEETIVYPRASGYVRSWSVDIGAHVKPGDLLAEIDTPEVDQQLAQARAQFAQAQAGVTQAQANDAYATLSLKRLEKLVPEGLAAQADLDKQKAQAVVEEANIAVAKANAEAAKAEIRRLSDLKAFSRLTAPFAGIVAARNIERGALVTAGNATPLFRIVATETMRVLVQVPQDAAPGVRVGVPAKVKVREFAGRTFDGTIAHAAGALDPATRMMRTEVRVPNPKGELLAGMYAEVSLTLPIPHRIFEVPATAVMNDAKGLRVAVVEPDSTVRLVPVMVERDTGATIQLASGLQGNERVVRLANAELYEGRKVEIAD
jgi:RND family efflux transporter MFP subunit